MTSAHRTRTRLVGALGAGVLALALAACGGDSEQAAPQPAGSAATSATAPPASSPAAATPADGASGGSAPAQIAGLAAAVKEAGSAKVSVRTVSAVDGRKLSSNGEGVIDTEARSARMTLTVGGGRQGTSIKVIVADGSVYIQGLPGQPAGKWTRSNAAQQAGPLTAANPAQALDLLLGVSDDVKEAGKEELRGASTTRYTGTIDMEKVLERQGSSGGPDTGSMGLDEVPFEIFIDDEGRPARVEQTIALELAGKKVETVSTTDFYDWGTDADIQPPAESDVVSAPTS